MRERERERDAEQGDTSNSIKNCLMILKLENPLELLEDRIAINMNRFLHASLVFSSSSLKQRSMTSPPLLRVPRGRGLSGSVTYQTREVTRCSPLPVIFVGIKLPEF